MDRQRKLLDILLKPEIKFHRIGLPQQHDCKEEEILSDQQLCNQDKSSSLDHFDPTVIQYKEELNHQDPMLNIIQIPEIKLDRTDLSQQHNYKEGEQIIADQQLCNQERNWRLAWEEPEPPQVKEEQQVFCSNHEEEQHVLNEDTEPSIVTESNHIEPETSRGMLLSQNVFTGKKSLKYEHCVKSFPCQLKCNRHQRVVIGEKQFSCKTCGKCFRKGGHLSDHMRTHTGEKPFSCKTCGKCFGRNDDLTRHMRTHTGEKPYSCKTCGRCFSVNGNLTVHMRSHTGEKPFSCGTCGKRFSRSNSLAVHIRSHT
ncbi:zinc finger protein 571-like [Parambassis ranga]|uniref:Zinc finger protein 571-like n=1 Tax=Parambassis ranga TaxID=210632 RepID=A0A6P7HR06_9TELE|nr:zinc finger protein 571-like [Parambassis ranga]